MRRTLVLLLLWCPIGLAHERFALGQAGARPGPVRPVRDVTERPSPSSIEFVSFEFQEPDFSPHGSSADYRAIEGEPSASADYAVKASVGGEEAIATLLFEVVDEGGTAVQPIPMVARATGVPGHFEFIGMLTVPARPFRVRVTGEDIYGRRFSQTLRRAFKPRIERPAEVWIPDSGNGFVRAIRQMFDDARAERTTLAAGNPSGRIVMPRSRVSNVTYAPLVSASHRPVAIRVTYEVEFSQAGRYNPTLHIYAEDREDTSVRLYPLRPLKSTIQPVPREPYAPYDAAQTPGPFAHHPDHLYEAGIRYRFEVELVPEFVSLHRDSTIPCLVHEGNRYDSTARKAFARMLAREAATTYRVSIGLTAFAGRIDDFYGEGTFYRSLVAGGFTECERIVENER
jgi:hypothetical protein